MYIALTQLKLLPDKSTVRWLSRYLGRFFRIALGNLKGKERKDTRAEILWRTAVYLLNHWSFPEDWRAFRMYISNRIRLEARDYTKGTPNADANIDLDSLSSPALVAEGDDRAIENEEGAAERSSRRRPAQRVIPILSTRSSINVVEAAELLDCTKSYLYRLIRNYDVRPLAEEPLSISSDELRRLAEIRAEKLERRKKRMLLEKSGKTPSAARKAVYRKYGRIPLLS